MKARLQQAWHARAPRERRFISLAAGLLAIVLYALFVHSSGQARGPLRDSVATLRAQALRLDQHAMDHGRARAAPAVAPGSAGLPELVQARVAQAGLSGALVRIEATDARQVVVVFGALPFGAWLDLMAGLDAQRVRLASCRIEAMSSPGQVTVTATLVRAGP